jgi:hypothetical protein
MTEGVDEERLRQLRDFFEHSLCVGESLNAEEFAEVKNEALVWRDEQVLWLLDQVERLRGREAEAGRVGMSRQKS